MHATMSHNATSDELQQFLAPTDGNDLPENAGRGHGIWGPGIRMMRNMQFVAKGGLIGILFLIPIIWLSWAYFSNNATQIAFSAKERMGVQYTRAIFPVLDLAQQLRRNTTASSANTAELADIQSKWMAAHQKLESTDHLLGAELGSAKAFAATQSALAQTRQAQSADTVFAAHSAYVASLITLLEQVTDASNLTLDPDIDSYYVMDTALFRLPSIMESVAKLRDLGWAGMQAGSLTPAHKLEFSEIVPLADYQLGAMNSGMAKAGAYNSEVTSRTPPGEAADASAAFFSIARKSVLNGSEFTPELQAAYLGAASKALSSQYQLSGTSLDMLDRLLAARIQSMETQRLQTIGILALGLLLALYFFYSFFLVTRGGLQLISKHLDEMSQGDLRHRPRKPWGTDEPARVIQDLRQSYDSLHILIRKVRHSARTLHAASAEIAAASSDLGSRTEHAASELEQQASAMEEIGSTVSATADLATMAAAFAMENAGVAEQGGAVFAEVVRTMREIHASSSRINDIISVIDGIAFQTNILALNAAVEAARAGESGRGFAVVASEVRGLAQRSASAAREIKGLISASVDKVESGTRVVEAAGQTMGDVVANARQINQFLSEISVAARDQAGGVTEIGRSIQELDQGTQQNAALVEETMAAAAALTSQADVLQGEIANFKVA